MYSLSQPDCRREASVFDPRVFIAGGAVDGLTITVRIPMTLYGTCSVKSFLSYCFLFQTT
jgi:hypothetical protein